MKALPPMSWRRRFPWLAVWVPILLLLYLILNGGGSVEAAGIVTSLRLGVIVYECLEAPSRLRPRDPARLPGPGYPYHRPLEPSASIEVDFDRMWFGK